MIRKATLDDIPALVALEERSFETDRFSRRAFRYLLTKANAATLVETAPDGTVRGYATVLFMRDDTLARLYSIAVDPAYRGRDIGKALLHAAEAAAQARGVVSMRLEVRADNAVGIALYQQQGYRRFAIQPHYYEDEVDAVRMEKSLVPSPDPNVIRVPYYAQSLDFTCGPASLLMAMHALDPGVAMSRAAEVSLWREATTVFMMSGHGGCSPEGLALAAHRRGFAVDLFLGDAGVFLIDSVRSPKKKEVIRLVQEEFRTQLARTDVAVTWGALSLDEMQARFEAGGIPVVFVSSYRFDRERLPHWVVVTGFDDRFVYLHEPHVDTDNDRTATDCMQIPVLRADFARMARYGRARVKAALILSRRSR